MRAITLCLISIALGLVAAMVPSLAAYASEDRHGSVNERAPVSSDSSEPAAANEAEEKLAPDGQPYLLWANQMNGSIEEANRLAEGASQTRITLIAWGGTKEMQEQAYLGYNSLQKKAYLLLW